MELVFIGKDSKKSVSFEENRNELLLKKVNMKIHTVKKHNIKLGNISTYPASITALQIKKIYKKNPAIKMAAIIKSIERVIFFFFTLKG